MNEQDEDEWLSSVRNFKFGIFYQIVKIVLLLIE